MGKKDETVYNEKKKGKKILLQSGRELPTSTADWGLFYSVLVCCCACTYMSFQSSLLSSRGWGIKAAGGSFPQQTGVKRIEYFVIVQSEGDSMYISILYICDENALAFCVTLPFTCTMVLHSVFQC